MILSEGKWFDGAVTQKAIGFPDGMWVDEWHGPGGRLIVTRLDRSAPAAQIDVDALETLYRPDGTTEQHALAEGDDYHTLPELMGEHWAEYKAMIMAVRHS